jgi:hypothetical protein
MTDDRRQTTEARQEELLIRPLSSPFDGFEDRVHAVAAAYFRALFDLGLVGLVHTSNVLAGLKFVIAIGFLAYLIDFARAMVVGRDTNRETLDAVLVLAAIALMFWAWPALVSADAALIRLHASQFLLLSGAMIVIVVERHIEEARSRGQASGVRRQESGVRVRRQKSGS